MGSRHRRATAKVIESTLNLRLKTHEWRHGKSKRASILLNLSKVQDRSNRDQMCPFSPETSAWEVGVINITYYELLFARNGKAWGKRMLACLLAISFVLRYFVFCLFFFVFVFLFIVLFFMNYFCVFVVQMIIVNNSS